MEEVFYLERNIPINRFVKLTYKTLGSTGLVPLQRLEYAYREMRSIIHEGVESASVDIGALSYVCSRLPDSIFNVENILVGQSEQFFRESGVDIDACTEVFAKARRRRYLFDGVKTLIVYISSKSDLDDVIPSLLALQIEWNKCHSFLQGLPMIENNLALQNIASFLRIELKDAERLKRLLGSKMVEILRIMQDRRCDFRVKNHEASYCQYKKETEDWWNHIKNQFPDIQTRPVYFVSSNTHSLINLISGFAEYHESEILEYAQSNPEYRVYLDGYERLGELSRSNLLYYLLMQYEQDLTRRSDVTTRRVEWEKEMGVYRIASNKTLDIPTQIIDLQLLAKNSANPRIQETFKESDALILNIDYPLGRTAYFILTKLAEHVSKILGVYVIGKAASLFANRGDVLIPSSISDQHTKNQYYIDNCIEAKDVMPFLEDTHNGIYDNQRAVTVLGTMLQNKEMLDTFLLAGVTDLEMEAGPYLAAVYEILLPKRYPEMKSISLSPKSFDLGIIHYVSDNPLSDQKLDSSLHIHGVDATYACTRAVLDKVLVREEIRNA